MQNVGCSTSGFQGSCELGVQSAFQGEVAFEAINQYL